MNCELITSCTCVAVDCRTKTVIRTADVANDVSLTDKSGRTWGACSNFGEPFDFQTHIFYLPDKVLDEPVTVRWTRRSDKQEVTATLLPDMVTTTTIANFIDETKRLSNPHRVYIDLSKKLYDEKQRLLNQMSVDDE